MSFYNWDDVPERVEPDVDASPDDDCGPHGLIQEVLENELLKRNRRKNS